MAQLNQCYNPHCQDEQCFNPQHYNFICMDPECEDHHCENKQHYNKQLLKNFQKENMGNLGNNCDCENLRDDIEDVIDDSIPFIQNRPIKIILSSAIFFALAIILQYMSFTTISPIMFLIVTLISGYDIAILAKNALASYNVTPSVLACIAAIASFAIGHYEEAAAVMFLYFIAEFLEDYSEHRAKHSIKTLVEIAPEKALIYRDGREVELKIDDVKVNEIAIIKPGDKVPLDGEVVKGTSNINQAAITGESTPVVKTIGDKVFSGTVNIDGYLEVVVKKEAKDSVISKIADLVQTARLNRSKTESLVERVAKYYTPSMVVIIILVAFIPPLFFGGNLVEWVYRSLSLMVISCPCAFLISTPIGMVSAITSATKKGILIKGSTYVEEMRHIKAIIFDKTGTLTEGKLEVSDVKLLSENYSKDEMIQIATTLENYSSHPISNAIMNYAQKHNIEKTEIENFKNIPGKGISGFIGGVEYYTANESLIDGGNFNITQEDIQKYTSMGKTVVYVGCMDEVIGIITVVDKIRDEAVDVIANLKAQNIETIMLTGDNKTAAESVADTIGIDYVYSNLLPEDKINILDTIRNKFGDVIMVGDGVNDAPALARADVGIAMGAVGSDVAIETADIALMHDDLSKLPYLCKLSNKTMGIIKQNIIAALVIKLSFIALAICGLITLMMAVGFGDLGLTMLVILNSFRIGVVKDPIF